MPEIRRNLTGINRSVGNNGRAWIVVHNVGTAPTGEGAAYDNTLYFGRAYRGSSAHYFVDDGPVIWQCVDDADTSWACGEAPSRNGCYNSNSINVEVCGDGEFSAARRDNLRWLVRRLMSAHDIDAAHVIRHNDVTGKHCPAHYAGAGNAAWSELHAYITDTAYTEGDDDMPTVDEIMNYPITDPDGNTYPFWQHVSWGRHYAKNAAKDVWDEPIPEPGSDNEYPAWQILTWDRYYAMQQSAQIDALTEAVKALSTMQGADPGKVVKAVTEAVDRKLASISVDVEVKSKAK